jgi:Ser/Thr protein kinase RdoA (MazF antagonist)
LEVERSIQHIQLNHEQLLAVVCKAFPHCHKLDEWVILSGGALNTTYKFKIGPNEFVLRLYARDRKHCKTEKMIHQLIEHHVSTPKLIYADESHEPFAYSIFEFVPGKHISEISYEKKIPLSYELGHVLASIHKFKLPQAGLFGDGMKVYQPFAVGSSPYFDETFSVLTKSECVRKRLGDKLVDETLTFVQRNKEFFPLIEDHVCLTHSDYKPVNLLYYDEKIFVLDWEFAHAGIGILDFAILLRHRNHFPCNMSSLAEGYRDFGGKLRDDWFRSALIIDFVNMMTLLDSPTERPKLFHQLKTTIQTTMTHW